MDICNRFKISVENINSELQIISVSIISNFVLYFFLIKKNKICGNLVKIKRKFVEISCFENGNNNNILWIKCIKFRKRKKKTF